MPEEVNMNRFSILMKRISYAAVASLLAFATLAFTSLPALADAPTAVFNGGGHGTLTDPDGNTFPIQFAIAGNVADDGTASGNINFVFQGDMADYWGAIPGVVDTFHVYGKVTAGSIAPDGSVTIEGTVTELDFDQGNGKVFVVVGDPFVIVAGGSLGENVFTLQYCELPTWQIAVTSGNLSIH